MRRRKYNNTVIEVDGVKFHSKKEALRYGELKELERGGEIRYLSLQKRFDIVINQMKVCSYIADFEYIDCESNRRVVEDVKGYRTDMYKLKRKLMKAVNGIEVVEV